MYSRREMLALGACSFLSACSKARAPSPQTKVGGSPPSSRHDRPNIIVYLADTLRADHLSCYNYPIQTSPRIDEFSQNSIFFEQCYSQAPWTKPSIGAIFTGLLPRMHRAVASTWYVSEIKTLRVEILRDQFVTLAEALKTLGYNTALFQSNPHVQKEFGFAQGFDHYHYAHAENPVQQMDAVLHWLEESSKEPFFLFVHEVDPHGPYRPEKRVFHELFGSTPEEALSALPNGDKEHLENLRTYYREKRDNPALERPDPNLISPAGNLYQQQLYDAEIRRVDTQFDRLVQHLDGATLASRTATVFTADHGEAFNEHGHYFHGNTLYDEEIHVPLVIRIPGQRGRTQVPHTVSLFDLYPTLITLAGGAPSSHALGRTLVNENGELLVDSDRYVFSDLDPFLTQPLDWPAPQHWDASMIHGSRKVVSFDRGRGIRVFDRAVDPEENNDLLATAKAPDRSLEELVSHFRAAREKHMQLAASFGEPEWTEGNEELRQELEALGYL